MDAQVVYEREDGFDMHTGPYGYTKVGIRIESRVIWLALLCGSGTKEFDEYQHWEKVARKIETALNND